MPADSRESDAAWMVSGKLLLVSPIRKRNDSIFQKQKPAVFSSGNIITVDSVGDADRMCT